MLDDTTPEHYNAWMLDALKHLDQGITVFDHQLRLVAWNRRWHELLDFPEQLAQFNQHIEVLFRFNAERGEYGAGDIDALVAERVELAKHFKPHVFERLRPDGTIIEIRGNPMANGGFVTTYTDVTTQRQAEAQLEQRVIKRTEELRNSENWIRQIADAVPALIAYVDKDNRYQFINHMHQQWFGLQREQLLGTSIFELVEKRNMAQFKADVARVLCGEEVQSEYELRRQHKRPMHVSISFIPHFDDQQQLQGYFFLGQDLTDYKQTQRELLESHKMQALGLLTGGVAHDFNNLLTIILGNLTLLEEPRLDDEEMREAILCCQQAAQRGSNLIQRLLTFSRRQSLKPEITGLNELIADFTTLLQRTLGETVLLQSQLSPQLPPIRVDRNQLETSLLNLVLNSRDAMPNGGSLTITTSTYQRSAQTEETEEQAFSDLAPGHYVMLIISDEGKGMSAETISRAFEPFYTTKPAGLGTGLGLSMVYGFVRQSGGGIEIRSRRPRGTEIRLLFPAELHDTPVSMSGAKINVQTEQHANILLVEDDAGVRQYVQRTLKKMGYQVEVVENGEHALNQLAQTPNYDLILTDIVMPGSVSGLDIYKQVRQDYPTIKVLCMTGYSDQLEETLADIHLLRKPFQQNQLANKLQALLN